MRFISDPSLPGNGRITGVFHNQDSSVVAIASFYPQLTNPPARASYWGQHLHYRVALYRPPETTPFTVFDRLRYPINDIGFHPEKPVVVIGTGRYDGGWKFDGELIVWDWESNRDSKVIGPVPEVERCKFCSDGTCIIALVRPWTEDSPESVVDPYDSFFEVRASYSEQIYEGIFNKESISQQITEQVPRSAGDVEADNRFPARLSDPETALRQSFKLSSIHVRSAVWDVAWLGDDDIGIVHDDCQLEILDSGGTYKRRFMGDTYGAQILKGSAPIVHAIEINEEARDWSQYYRSHLYRFAGSELIPLVDRDGELAFSISREGWIIGRQDRSFVEAVGPLDVIGSPDLESWSGHDFGHYDSFNHFLRIDGAPHLFAVQGTPPDSHEKKWLCLVSPTGKLKRLWPLLPSNVHHSDHVLDCAFEYLSDTKGEAVIMSGQFYVQGRSPEEYSGFIGRRRLEDGKEIWRHETKANATMIKAVPGRDVVLAAFLDGEVAAFEGTSGDVLQRSKLQPDGYDSVVFSFDVSRENIVLGTVDGRVGIISVDSFLQSGFA